MFFEQNMQQGRPPLWILLKRKGRQHCTKETQQKKKRRSYLGSKPWGGRRIRLDDLYRKGTMDLYIIEPMSLKLSFFAEGALPRGKRGPTPIKDEVVLLLPNFPCRNDEEFHEEEVLRLSFSLLHHLEELSSEIPIDSKVLLAGFAKRTVKEKMESSFFNVAKDKAIVISFKLMLFPFQDISCIYFIHEEQP
jgi:hypothetical protein